jgi:hypothetical protein
VCPRRGRVTAGRNRKPALLELLEALLVICPHSPLIGTIGKVGQNFSLQRKISEITMSRPQLDSEPYEISARFHCALQAKALRLEADALADERAAESLDHPGHLQRQKLLIQAQRRDAGRFRTFLTRTRVRSK